MNTVEIVVVEVLSEPYQFQELLKTKSWFVDVVSEYRGRRSKGALEFETKEEALAVKEGYTFQC